MGTNGERREKDEPESMRSGGSTGQKRANQTRRETGAKKDGNGCGINFMSTMDEGERSNGSKVSVRTRSRQGGKWSDTREKLGESQATGKTSKNEPEESCDCGADVGADEWTRPNFWLVLCPLPASSI